MSKTPIADFVKLYAQKDNMRLHMPGHKGYGPLGVERYDLTEVSGADSLYEAEGIIKQSEDNASALFGCPTYYSTEGSSQCIRAMLQLFCLWADQNGKPKKVLAGRNAHKTFLSAAALLGFDTKWITGHGDYLGCDIDPNTLKAAIEKSGAAGVYITSPDYLGRIQDIKAIAKVCCEAGALLMVDNAHGAYLRFLPESQHPIDLGADLCCDSAHKTLPVITGGAYLHIAPQHEHLAKRAKNALALFGSTSPSYLILQSLDLANPYLEGVLPDKLHAFTEKANCLKTALKSQNFTLVGDEVLKVTIDANAYGYTGYDFAAKMAKFGAECEFCDETYVVMMLGVDTNLAKLQIILCSIPKLPAIKITPPAFDLPPVAMSPRKAMLANSEQIKTIDAEGRVLASPGVGCPPAVPIVMCGEVITPAAAKAMLHYNIDKIWVVKE